MLHGVGKVALVAMDHRQDTVHGHRIIISLDRAPLRYYVAERAIRVATDVVAEAFAASVWGAGGMVKPKFSLCAIGLTRHTL